MKVENRMGNKRESKDEEDHLLIHFIAKPKFKSYSHLM